MSLYGVALPFPFTETKGPSTNMLQHDNFSVYKAISLTTWYAKIGMEELEWLLPKPSWTLSGSVPPSVPYLAK